MIKKITKSIILVTGFMLLFSTFTVYGQACEGGAISTKESYLYGRFEVAMQSVSGSGIVSSFFLYNIEVGCNWPAQNNEIDIEMTGNTDSVYFTTHHPGPWHYGEALNFDFSPHATVQRYAIEWEPGTVRWFVDDQIVYIQNESATNDLKYPMAILMNLWASDAVSWVGEWDASILPLQSKYDYVKYYRYAPGQGNAGTNNNFMLEWEDNFDNYDRARWDISEFDRLGGSYCSFRSRSVSFSEGFLYLTMNEAQPDNQIIPVTFSVNMQEQNLSPSDIIYLNGNFNDWCGTCNPMNENNGIWSLTLNLAPEKYEYVFTKNNWEETGQPPIGSDCDFSPCDEFANYGLIAHPDSVTITTDTYCWNACAACQILSVVSSTNPEKELLRIYDILGRETKEESGKVLFYFFDDGTIEKRIILDINP